MRLLFFLFLCACAHALGVWVGRAKKALRGGAMRWTKTGASLLAHIWRGEEDWAKKVMWSGIALSLLTYAQIKRLKP